MQNFMIMITEFIYTNDRKAQIMMNNMILEYDLNDPI